MKGAKEHEAALGGGRSGGARWRAWRRRAREGGRDDSVGERGERRGCGLQWGRAGLEAGSRERRGGSVHQVPARGRERIAGRAWERASEETPVDDCSANVCRRDRDKFMAYQNGESRALHPVMRASTTSAVIL